MNCFFRDYHDALHWCSKPYQYVGGEFLSYNKDFDSADVKFAFAFPDKYEIGISNLGLRILYDLVNRQDGCMADRVYAPEPDFTPETLYGLESKQPIKNFDAIGLSLQYEMSYPTVLKLLEMSGIPYKNSERSDDDPIIFAGGPCTFNPLPMSDFVDVFLVGDGEDSIIEICEILKKTKGLPRDERIKALSGNGRWSKLAGGKVTKRIAQLDFDRALKSYPIPFSSSVQDRAVVEIRRGCGRMCRFCQPGHVTLPVRERPAEDIIKIAKELVNNTGYDEYSLLSLSSNDYSNINEVIKELAIDFNEKKISVSLPSQRIDGFNLELANLVQSVRKSTMTLAPEAGSQRLRDVIKKNITDEQIFDTVLTLYKNGWSRLKFYFICGLPTETKEDMEDMANLLKTLRYRCKLLKKEFGFKHDMDITCTLSIFVPKPFTPFQWCPQMDLDKITEHIYYLKDLLKKSKGIKVNYHEKFVSQIEAVLTRGDDKLCDYIEALYKKGCYLDAWGEYFNKDVWYDTAQELGISLSDLAQRQYDLDEDLPWDFVDVGIDKSWFKQEYNKAFNPTGEHIVTTCEKSCVGCGVCKNLNTKKVMADSYKLDEEKQKKFNELKIFEQRDPKTDNPINRPVYKYRLKITKEGILRYFSHLDWQNSFLKALARTNLNIAYSQGFNPTMKVSMGVALPLFVESQGELVDVEIYDDISAEEFKTKLEKVLPKDAKIVSIEKIDKSAKAIDVTAQWAEYKISILNSGIYNFEKLVYDLEKVLSSEEIFIEKKNKKGLLKKIDIKSSIKSYRYEGESLFIVLKSGQCELEHEQIPALRADVLMNIVAPDVKFNIVRTRFFDDSNREL